MKEPIKFSSEALRRLHEFITSHELCRDEARQADLRNIIEALLEPSSEEISLEALEVALTKVSQDMALSLDMKSGKMIYSDPQKTKPDAKRTKASLGPGDFTSGKTCYYIFFTVLLPLAAIIIELIYRPFSDSFFDPLPDFLHVILCSLPPLNNLIVYLQLKSKKAYNPKIITLQNAALAASFYYCLYFVPLSPLSALAILFMGMGFLSLSPLFSFSGVYRLRKRYYQMHQIKSSKLSAFLKAIALLLVLLIISKTSTAITEYGISQYLKATNPKEEAQAASFIRSWGSSEHILKKAQRGFGSGTAAVGDFPVNNHIPKIVLQKLYFQVTGEMVHQIKKISVMGRSHSREMSRRWRRDNDIGDQEIGAKQDVLFLVSSQFDSKLDADPAIAYSEWIMEFENQHQFQNREARMEILLPDQAVLSRLTLWVNGEEREAAFAKNSKVISAYKNIVRQNRDPVLVTWSAKNRIFVECFPVLPQERMKIRLGITSPMPLSQDKKKAYFYPPQILASNFHLAKNLNHDIWLEAKQSISSPTIKNLSLEQSQKQDFSLRGKLSHTQMTQLFRAELPRRDIDQFWGLDHHDESKIIRSTIHYDSPFPREKFLVLIDASSSMSKEKDTLIPSLKKLLKHPNFRIFLAEDELTEIKSIEQFIDFDFEGGRDNLYALDQVIELTDQHHSIIWLHGPQPYQLSTSKKLNQYQKRRGLVPIYNFQFSEGANKVLQEIKNSPHYSNLAASNRTELIDLFDRMLNPTQWPHFKREYVDAESFNKNEYQASSHLCRLMVADEALQCYFSDQSNYDVMAAKAARYQLVTPLSGAVVLETQAQYDAAGLEPVDSASVPSVPEPETWALIIILCLLLIYYSYTKKASLLKQY
ncbi:VIT domain-containing protein [Lentisphaera marina]|uniref:VIT domain-containing protein n=1 Tax=Lentisphaera marina TaxID=1111041 RepID=UPI00236668FC|nr:VIT domain-containing protein [Lentisphaera marina]MDD7985534.1 VIT domain-containing protein [Lentisphaera marina]